MSFKAVPFVALLLLVVHFSRPGSFPAQARPAPVRGVVLESCERVDKFCVAKITNVSHRNVVAVGMSIGGESNRGESMNFYSASESGMGLLTFPPGTTKETHMSIDPDAPTLLPVVDLVVYDDDTAEVANEQAFKEALKMREEQVLTLEKELEILKRFASSESRVADTVAELKRVAGEVPSIREDDRPYPSRMELEELAMALKRGWTDPQKATEETTEKLEAAKRHAHITRITGDDL